AVYRHFDIHEKDKPSEARIGQTLIIKEEKYENIDELIARFVDPMNSLVDDVVRYKYYNNALKENVEEDLIKQKKEHPSRIPYALHLKMKFVAGFVLAAVTITTIHAGNPSMQTDIPSDSASDTASLSADSSESDDSDSSCNFMCPAVMRPTMDENGVMYSNECAMRAAKCREKKGIKPVKKHESIFDMLSSKEDSGDDSISEESESTSGEESTDGTPKSYCPNISCPAVYQPVTDDNGVTYPNECAMKAAKCKGPRENPLDEYKRIYGREFGAPRSGDESASEESESSSGATKMVKSVKGPNKASKSTKKSFTSASGVGNVYEDGSEGVIDDDSSKSNKKCAGACPDVVLPVCGSDGIKYSNPCELKVAACKYPDQNIVEDDSACSNTSRDDMLLKESTSKIGTM
ncbi:Epi6-like protease inhibitor, partial [Phytophthora palmivora]